MVFLEFEKNGRPIKFLFGVCKWKSSRSSEQKSNLNRKNRVMSPQSVHKLEPGYRLRTPWIKGRLGPLETGPCYTTKIFLSPILSQCDWWPLPGWLCIGENETISIYWDYWTLSELTLISEDPKCHCGLHVRLGAYGGHVMSGIFAWVYLTVQWALESGSSGPCGYLPRSRIYTWITHTQQLAESPNLNKIFCLILNEPMKLKNETDIFPSRSMDHGVYNILKYF